MKQVKGFEFPLHWSTVYARAALSPTAGAVSVAEQFASTKKP
jgi:hypothetical protein